MAYDIAQLAAKREGIALVGGKMYHQTAQRYQQPKNDGSEGQWASYKIVKYLLPEAGAPPSTDGHGRPHIRPQWTGDSDNHEFLKALVVRMITVSVWPV